MPKWVRTYRAEYLVADLQAGILVAMVLVPQATALAALAGLPPQYGFYASILPPVVYAVLGTSAVLAVGPAAVATLMVASALSPLAAPGQPEYAELAILLALLTGLVLLAMWATRLGYVVKFVSQPVLVGFMGAASVLIVLSQIRPLAGTQAPWPTTPGELPAWLATVNLPSLTLGLLSIALLLFVSGPVRDRLAREERPVLSNVIGRSGPLLLVLTGICVVWLLDAGGRGWFALVGEVPSIVPHVQAITLRSDTIRALLPSAAVLAMIVYVESFSVAKVLAAKRRQRIDANRELLALGAANVASAFSGGFSVAGGFARSLVNFKVGARTPLASIVTALCMLLAGLSLTGLFVHLPRTILAAIIIVAVAGLLNIKEMWKIWRYDKGNGISLLVTFLGVLSLGVELGIVMGVGFSIVLLLTRSSQPHIAIVGRVPGTEHFRNVDRHQVETLPHVVAIRIDENLYFANSQFLEDQLMGLVAERPNVQHLVLICSGVNYIDASALETLEMIIDNLREAGVTLHLAEVKGPVTDRLKRSDLRAHLGEGRVYLSTHTAMKDLVQRK